MSIRTERSHVVESEEPLIGPIHGDLLGADHLAAQARTVARERLLLVGRRPPRPARLLARLEETHRLLTDAHVRLTAATAAGVDAGPAAEWFLDNYHVVVQEHLQEVRASLPGGYYRELPELASGPLAGYPRVYEIAISLISHTEARVDLESVDHFVEAFQTVTPLSIGELWAMPAMLRLGLIESVRRMTLRTVQRLDDLDLAVQWANRILAALSGGDELRAALREFIDANIVFTPHFVATFLQSLRQAEGASQALAWLEHWLRDVGVSPENAVARSTQRLALTQIVMGNSITSLRDIGRSNWRLFVEKQSVMEAVLREDPSGFYQRMTFATRDRYRHVVERIARRTGHREESVARWAVDLARRDAAMDQATTDARRSHVGFYLVDDGVAELERMARYSPTVRERLERMVRSHPTAIYIGGLSLLSIVALLAMAVASGAGVGERWWLILLLGFLPALDVAVAVFNQLVPVWLPPHILPRLDLQDAGVPEEFRTVVVVPTLFADVESVREALQNVETQFLANRDAGLTFAILSDFIDAPDEERPGDAAIVASALEGVRSLNDRYASGGPDAFYLLHRPRRWNVREGVWMGWERKRGKLSDFNQLLRGGTAAAFSVISGDPSALQNVRYVITLDADTVLPPDSAMSMVGALAHPLNRAGYDPEGKRVVRGYGILQPRVDVSLPTAHRSRFAAIASGHPGVDPYTTAVSDVYQDLFGEGSFTGKGIYDLDAFQRATHGRFPENTLLSHDLIEGNYARAGLATDVVVYDEYPSSYVTYTKRKHRWIRGDWQLLPWLRRVVPGPDGPERNRLSILSRWKILDNLRRSLVEISQLTLLVGGWTVLPGASWRWTLVGLAAIVAPWATSLLLAVIRPPRDGSWRAYYAAVAQDAVVYSQQAAITLACLPHQAAISADAIVRTLFRLFVSGRRLLEWQTASFVERIVSDLAAETWRSMRASQLAVGAGLLAFTYVTVQQQVTTGRWNPVLPLGGSILLLWLFAPLLMTQLSRPLVSMRRNLSTAERATATRYATLHWQYFAQHVGSGTRWLAPDNVQTNPGSETAMRTSPTNIGLQLLATVSARDLGFITADVMTHRLEQAFAALSSMPRYRGHFYNWYDLPSLSVLPPPYVSVVDSGNLAGHLIAVRQACRQIAGEQPDMCRRLHALADQADGFVQDMEFGFLYDRTRKLFTIGYHPESFTPDAAYYDLLASEARLASFVAIAKSDVPVEHWFRLSRALNRAHGATALLSWSGSMFEYLMPALVMRSLPFTLLDLTYRSVLQRHIGYARERDVPWGSSESAYNVRDRHQTYQYRGFGVPDLALKRGLGRDLVIAPYASALAAMVDPPRALANLYALEAMGTLGDHGFYDAVDYTRPEEGQRFAIVYANMAHHIGMTLVALTNVLRNDVWQERFHADPLVKAAELLLHERVPRRLVLRKAQPSRPAETRPESDRDVPVVREVTAEEGAAGPRVALLGSAPYTVMLNHNGSGYSRYESLAVTRWRADRTQDGDGQFCYVKQLDSGRVWSSALQPVGASSLWYRVELASDKVTLHRVDGDIETKTEITVVPVDSAEVRRITLTNTGQEPRDIELTSYGEVVMAPQAADRAHPAFSNLFVETEWHAWCSAITATRRPRDPDEPRFWCVHVVDTGRDRPGNVTCETDRARFIGRGRSLRNPAAMETDGDLSGTTGAVLDPIIALRTRVRIEPGQSTSVSFTTLVATSREQAFALADRYHDPRAAQRALDVAWTSADLELRALGISPANAAVYQDLATQLVYAGGSLAPPADELRRNRGSQPQLWPHGISGELPIVLATIDSLDGLPTLRELFAAHRFWRHRGLMVDLVVINTHTHDYLQELRDSITESMIAANDASSIDQPGGVMVRRRDLFQPDEYLMLSATARVHISCDGRSLNRILSAADARVSALAAEPSSVDRRRAVDRHTPMTMPTVDRGGALSTIVTALKPLVKPLLRRPRRSPEAGDELAEPEDLRYFNGIGGLDEQGDYEMIIDGAHLPPSPWVNVIANPRGGFVVSERGAGYTWVENSYFYRLTPWHNDPVSDPISDALFLQDADTGDTWSATPAPIGGGTYHVRHGPGRSTFELEHDGIRTELLLSVPGDAAAKVSLLSVRNQSERTRRITLTAYVDWALGPRREETQFRVTTSVAPDLGAILAQNRFDAAFANWVAFLCVSEPLLSWTADRRAFLGPGGSLADPAGLREAGLDGVTGVGLDPCAALQLELTLEPDESRDISVLLGAARSDDEARRMVERLRKPGDVRRAITRTLESWTERLGVISVRTPDPKFDAMLNKWTLYQTLACRLWARTGLYQSSGAYGFRDQLQDVLALVYAEPLVARQHILRAAARQFLEGDVQHWWHPQSGQGVRTRFSDDLVWLPFAVDRYVRVTGDTSILSEYAPFLTMRPLEPYEHEVYDLPVVTDEHGSVYEHCRRALRHACTVGPHRLPLIGTGDWNDGMNRVGIDGRGESVWLAWFLIATLRSFADQAESQGDHNESHWMRQHADRYEEAVEASGWDGQWYRRAYYDDGTPLGSASSDECRIDSIAQSWSVIADAGSFARRHLAMRALNEHLVREDARVIMLLTPPFDRGTHDPGYIMGYVPGVRENGAQYTHAALWAVMATARQGDGDRAFDLLQMINPLHRSGTRPDMERYKVEPYVVAADVYTAPAHLGRGGWTWYTGSASWMYRVGLEEILGFRKVGDTLRMEPRVPTAWEDYEVTYRFGKSTWVITVRDPAGVQHGAAAVTVDGTSVPDGTIRLVDDGQRHTVEISPAPETVAPGTSSKA